MSKKLAIKGHPTRGKEVVELLEMMGGRDVGVLKGNHDYYVIDECENNLIKFYGHNYIYCHEFVVLTIEEFLEKYPFKVGDKVFLYDNITEGCVTGMKWDEDKGTVKYCVYTSAECWCDVIELFKWNALDLVEKHYDEHCDDMYKTMFMIGPVMAPDKVDDKLEYNIIDGYEFDKVENGKIILKPIKPKYPTTYEDCCKVLGISYRAQLSYTNPEVECSNIYLTKEKHFLDAFMKLRICRNAYWKIAGEEMGLGKPWDSTYGCGEWGYWFGYSINENKIYLQDSRILLNHTLVFPTKEMRDAFYENFKDLIEQCKELL